MDLVINYLAEHWIEVAGAVLSFIYLYLSINQKIGLWIFGFLCSALYVVVFFQSKFYAGMTLQLYYLGVSIYGWLTWKRGKQITGNDLPIIHIPKSMILDVLAVFLVIFILYFFVLSNFTDSPVPRADSFTTALSIIATWMLARKMIENWLLFIVADGVCMGLYFYRELYPTAILFAVYTIMAIIGYFEWKRTMNREWQAKLRKKEIL